MFKTRFISMLALLLMTATGAWATITVTWDNDDITGSGNSFTKDGVTITAGSIDFDEKNFEENGTFTTSLGNFTKIEVVVTNGFCDVSGTGWSGDSEKSTWTGNASSVSFSGDIYGDGNGIKFVFTIEPATVAVTGVTLSPTTATLTLGETETVTLIPTVLPAEATDKSVTWSSSDEAVATVTDGVVTAVAAGTATITVTTTDGAKTATCAVTVAAPAASTYTVTLKEGTEDAASWTIAPAEATTTGVAQGTQVTASYGGVKKVKSVKAVKKAPAEPAGPTTVTWDFSQLSGSAVTAETPYENGGVTLSGGAALDFDNNMLGCEGECTFTAPEGKKFTSIVITASDWIEFQTPGWSGGTWSDPDGQTTINFIGGAGGISTIVFTLVETAAAGLTSYTLAESTVGMIVGTDGKAYDVADKDNLPTGVTAAGVVVYKDGSNGLAIALTDEASMMDWATACGESGAAAHTPAVEGQTWKLPSQEEWTLVKDANSASSLNSAITSAGGTAIPTGQFDPETMTMTGQYWLSTENGSDLARIWAINGWDEIVVSNADQDLKTSNNLVRACLAW